MLFQRTLSLLIFVGFTHVFNVSAVYAADPSLQPTTGCTSLLVPRDRFSIQKIWDFNMASAVEKPPKNNLSPTATNGNITYTLEPKASYVSGTFKEIHYFQCSKINADQKKWVLTSVVFTTESKPLFTTYWMDNRTAAQDREFTRAKQIFNIVFYITARQNFEPRFAHVTGNSEVSCTDYFPKERATVLGRGEHCGRDTQGRVYGNLKWTYKQGYFYRWNQATYDQRNFSVGTLLIGTPSLEQICLDELRKTKAEPERSLSRTVTKYDIVERQSFEEDNLYSTNPYQARSSYSFDGIHEKCRPTTAVGSINVRDIIKYTARFEPRYLSDTSENLYYQKWENIEAFLCGTNYGGVGQTSDLGDCRKRDEQYISDSELFVLPNKNAYVKDFWVRAPNSNKEDSDDWWTQISAGGWNSGKNAQTVWYPGTYYSPVMSMVTAAAMKWNPNKDFTTFFPVFYSYKFWGWFLPMNTGNYGQFPASWSEYRKRLGEFRSYEDTIIRKEFSGFATWLADGSYYDPGIFEYFDENSNPSNQLNDYGKAFVQPDGNIRKIIPKNFLHP